MLLNSITFLILLVFLLSITAHADELLECKREMQYRRLTPAEKSVVKSKKDICYLPSNTAENFDKRSWLQKEAGRWENKPMPIGKSVMYRYEIVAILGDGSYGIVYKVRDHCVSEDNASAFYAMKISFDFEKAAKDDYHKVGSLKYEFEHIDHCNRDGIYSNVISSSFCIQWGDASVMIMPLMETTIENIIAKHRKSETIMSIDTINSYTRKIVTGLIIIHARGIVHNDIKPSNILVSENSLKIADFGLSLRFPSEQEWPAVNPFFEAPEITVLEQGSFKSDIWSVGMVVANMYLLRPLLNPENAVVNFVRCHSFADSGQAWKYLRFLRVWAIYKMCDGKRFDDYNYLLRSSSGITLPEKDQIDQFVQTNFGELDAMLTIRPGDDSAMHARMVEFIRRCLDISPDLRPAASDLLHLPFLAESYIKVTV